MTTKYSILLVEDMRDIRELLSILLTDAGYVVTMAATGEEALAVLTAGSYALVLTDYHLPDMTGADVAGAAKQCEPPPKVLLMSGSTEVAAYAKSMGADAWFQKGDSPVDLLNQIERLLHETAIIEPSRWPDIRWIVPGKILTGPYPSDNAHQQRLLNAGVRLIIDLPTPEDTDVTGRPYLRYTEALTALAEMQGIELTILRLPITQMKTIATTIDIGLRHNALIYLHACDDFHPVMQVIAYWKGQQHSR